MVMADKTKPENVPVGLAGIVRLDLVPLISIEFKQLIPKQSGDFELEVPISGTCRNVNKDIPCSLTWLVTNNGVSKEMSTKAGVMKMQGDDFHIEVADANPTVNIIEDQLFGVGSLGCRLQPSFPHADEFDTPDDKCWNFNHTIDIRVDKPENLAFGSKIVFKPEFADVFEKAEIKLRLYELDEGDEEEASDDNYSSVISWSEGDRDNREWLVGFVGDFLGGLYLYFERHEEGDYEFGYTASVAYSRGPDDYIEKVFKEEKRAFPGVKKPALVSFGLDFQQQGLRFTDRVKAIGQIANLAPGCSIPIDIALVHYDSVGIEPQGNWPKTTVRAKFDDDGNFEATLFTKWAWSSESFPDPQRIFAILSLRPATASGGTLTPTYQMLDFNDEAFPTFEWNYFVHKYNATWVCSKEAKNKVELTYDIIDTTTIKKILYPQGNVDTAVHDLFKKLLAGEIPRADALRKGRCNKATAQALQRALVFLGYPTSSSGTYNIDGDFGNGTNKAFAYFIREHATELLRDDKGNYLTDDNLLSKKGLSGNISTVPVDKEVFEVLILSLNLLIKGKYVWFQDVGAAIENLEALASGAKNMSTKQIIQRYRGAINNAVEYSTAKGLRITPPWLVALIETQSGGRFRLHLDNSALEKYYTKQTPGAVFCTSGLANMMECRLRSTRFGLGNRMGSDYSFTEAKSAFDLFYASPSNLLHWLVDVLLTNKQDCTVVEKSGDITKAELPEVAKLSKAFTGTMGYAKAIRDSYMSAKKVW